MQRDIFRIELQRDASTLLLRLSGELDLAAHAPLCCIISLLALQAIEQVLVDTSGADFVDASIVGALFQLAQEVHKQGGTISHIDPRDPVRPIWRLTGWSELCPPLTPPPAPAAGSA